MAEKFEEDLLREVKGITDKTVALATEHGNVSAAVKTYQENSEKKMAEFDKKNEELVKQLAETEKKSALYLERLEHMEKIQSAGGNIVETKENLALYANDVVSGFARSHKGTKEFAMFANRNQPAFISYTKEWSERMLKGLDISESARELTGLWNEIKASPTVLRTDINEFGQFLVPVEWASMLDHQIIEITPIRQFARTMTIGSKTINQPIRQGVPLATWEGETDAANISQSNYTNIQISPYRLANQTIITWDLLQDSAYNISEEMISDNAIAMARAEGLAGVKGSGQHQSLGFVTDPNVPVYVNSIAPYTNSTTNQSVPISWQDLVLMTGQMKQGYNPMFAMNRRTLAYLRTLTDNNGRPVWLGPFGNLDSGPATINGYKYSAEFIDMDDVTVSNGNPIVFADFPIFYRIYDRTTVVLIRDEYTRAANAEVVFTLQKWTAGMPVVKEAGLVMKRNG